MGQACRTGALRVCSRLRQFRACDVTKSSQSAAGRDRDPPPLPLDVRPGAADRRSCLYVFFYLRRFTRAREEAGGRGAGAFQLAAFARRRAGACSSRSSPRSTRLGEDYLFSMHMVQHILLGDIAPLLVLLSPLARDHAPADAPADVRRARARAVRPPGNGHRRLADDDLRLAHPGDVRRGAQPRRASTRSSTPASSPAGSPSGGR